MLWVKAFHIIFVVTWFAGLFYLPRLFVYHAMSEDLTSIARFKVMERKLYFGIMMPSAVLTLVSGFALWLLYDISGSWLYMKVGVVAALVLYHLWCGKLLSAFAADRNAHGHVWYRWFNEIPIALLLTIVVLVVFKPL